MQTILFQVQQLQQLLEEEVQLHAILENAVEHSSIELSDMSCLPNDVISPLASHSLLKKF